MILFTLIADSPSLQPRDDFRRIRTIQSREELIPCSTTQRSMMFRGRNNNSITRLHSAKVSSSLVTKLQRASPTSSRKFRRSKQRCIYTHVSTCNMLTYSLLWSSSFLVSLLDCDLPVSLIVVHLPFSN
jgi:hypothetical protein